MNKQLWVSGLRLVTLSVVMMAGLSSCKKKEDDNQVHSGGGRTQIIYRDPNACNPNDPYCQDRWDNCPNGNCNDYCDAYPSDPQCAGYQPGSQWYEKYRGYFVAQNITLNVDPTSTYSQLRVGNTTYSVYLRAGSRDATVLYLYDQRQQISNGAYLEYSNRWQRVRLVMDIRVCADRNAQPDYWGGNYCRNWTSRRIDQVLIKSPSNYYY